MNNIMKKTLAVLLCAAAVTTSAFAQETADSEYDVMPLAAKDNEMNEDYNEEFPDGTENVWAWRVYEHGGLFSTAYAATGAQGLYSPAVSDHNAWTYVFMYNQNDKVTASNESTEVHDITRICETGITFESSDYATSVTHKARMTISGVKYFDISEKFTK